jgi:phage-related protein
MKLPLLPPLKPLRFIRSSQDDIKNFPPQARRLAGEQLMLVQAGKMPEDWKPMPTIGQGAMEIRIHQPHEHRVIYVAKFPEAVYVLHAFDKKTQKTPLKDLRKASATYAEMLKNRKK